MDKEINNLPYRDNVCCVVFCDDKFLLLQGIGWPKVWWKFPQGGIDDQETLEEAALRELKEETGSSNFQIIGKSKYSNLYDWNDQSRRLAGNRWRGQSQKYVLVKYLGLLDKIQVNPRETQDYQWVTLVDLWQHISHRDKNFTNYCQTIKKVLKEFSVF